MDYEKLDAHTIMKKRAAIFKKKSWTNDKNNGYRAYNFSTKIKVHLVKYITQRIVWRRNNVDIWHFRLSCLSVAFQYSDGEQEVFKAQLDDRLDKYVHNPATIPDTKLAR